VTQKAPRILVRGAFFVLANRAGRGLDGGERPHPLLVAHGSRATGTKKPPAAPGAGGG